MTDLAFLGTGVMGAPMALNLSQAGFAVHAWNRTAAKARALQSAGVQAYDAPAQAAAGCPVMVTMLADGEAVLGVARAALGADDPPETWIQMSTIGRPATERCQALADERDVVLVDAPVLGTRQPAEAGALVVLASGPEAARPVADPVFDAVGGRTIWLGEAGAASGAKIMLNLWVLGLTGVLAETLTLARAEGIDADVFFQAIDGGALDAGYARVKGAQMAKEDFSEVSFALSLARKDAELVVAAAETSGVNLPMMEGALRRLRAAEAGGHGDEDMAATYWASRPSIDPADRLAG